MAEASQVPTFKLVLVGDGGTGKVSPRIIERFPTRDHHTDINKDHFRQAPLDW